MNRLETTVLSSQTAVLLTQVPQAAKWIGHGPRARPIMIKGPVDFYGLERATGRMILFDAKTDGTERRFNVAHHVRGREQQMEELIRYGRFGAHAGLLIESTVRKRYFWLPWPMLLPVCARRIVSYAWEELIDAGDARRMIDWNPIFRARLAVSTALLCHNGRQS